MFDGCVFLHIIRYHIGLCFLKEAHALINTVGGGKYGTSLRQQCPIDPGDIKGTSLRRPVSEASCTGCAHYFYAVARGDTKLQDKLIRW